MTETYIAETTWDIGFPIRDVKPVIKWDFQKKVYLGDPEAIAELFRIWSENTESKDA